MRGLYVRPVVVISVLALMACSSTDDSPPGTDPGGPGGGERLSLTEEFERARERATSDLEREIWDRAIETGRLEQNDYEEVHAVYRRCVEDAGYEEEYIKESSGIYQIDTSGEPPRDPEEYLDATANCADSSGLSRVEAAYGIQVNNPGLLADPLEVAVQCLHEQGLAPADYTSDSLREDVGDDLADVPFDLQDQRTKDCLRKGGMEYDIDPNQDDGSPAPATSSGS